MADTTQTPTTLQKAAATARADPNRTLVVLGFFLLAFLLLLMIWERPNLLSDPGFTLVLGLVLGSGGIGAINNFYFGGTKTGSSVMESQSKTISNAAASGGLPDGEKGSVA